MPPEPATWAAATEHRVGDPDGMRGRSQVTFCDWRRREELRLAVRRAASPGREGLGILTRCMD